ncbi:hypothetical protein Fcan01_05047 [Folsomia candida]|uniref:Uncharacterized protein n=2 Tax=Folsomia candida TaxID=158441 RepID=A0A226EQZ7_FOLCA|nr:hypothetical protein Fcan01_05047 [Folsomia candida]
MRFLFLVILGFQTISSGFAKKSLLSSEKNKDKGDPGVLLAESGKVRPGRDTYRYYGTGSKGSSSSLLPTSPSKGHFYSSDAYGYGTPMKQVGSGGLKKGASIQDYLQLVDAIEELPPDFGEMAAASGYGSGGGGGYGHGHSG